MSLVLAIDTSCDDTSAAVVDGRRVLSNVILSQTELHQPYGGVFPTVAKKAHRENVDQAITDALSQAKVEWSQIENIAVTQGPGLAPALEVGITAAKKYAAEHNLPLIPVNHLEGHLWSVWADSTEEPVYPAIGLVISGGHTFFVKVNGLGEYALLGESIDDAAGEALDKVGRLLGLGYPAGARIEQLAAQGNPTAFPFPLPMTTSGDYNLSFSGMKTAAKNLYSRLEQPLSAQTIADFCASFQTAVFRAVLYKVDKYLQKEAHTPIEIWLGGGVAANQTLRRALAELPLITKVRVPHNLNLCRDNAAMIGVVANMNTSSATGEDIERKPIWMIGSST